MTKNQPTKIPFLKILNFILHKNQSDNNIIKNNYYQIDFFKKYYIKKYE